MNIIINTNRIQKALRIVERSISKNISLPILGTVLLKTERGKLNIFSTNLENGVICSMGAKIEEDGSVAIPVKIFSQLISSIVDEKIQIKSKGEVVEVIGESIKSEILSMKSDEFPLIPKISKGNKIDIQPKILRGAIYKVVDATSVSETRPELTGVFMSVLDEFIVFAATDSFRLSEFILKNKNSFSKSVIIPRNTAMEIMRICEDIGDSVSVVLGDSQISIEGEDVYFISRLIDGKYPEYSRVIPENPISKAIVSKIELEKNIRVAGVFSSSIMDVSIRAIQDSLLLDSKNSERGKFSTKINSKNTKPPFEVSLNYQYLLDGIKIVEGEEITLEFSGQGAPIVLRGTEKEHTYVVMPLRQ